MSNVLEKLLSKLPSHFRTDPDSVNYKLLSIVARQAEDYQTMIEAIQRFRDVDQAEGYGLDRIGKDEGISRGPHIDEVFRKLIKIQYIVNLSDGNIEDMNTVMRVYMGEHFLGVEDLWNHPIRPEMAAFYVNYHFDYYDSLPKDVLRRIKAAGVRATWHTVGKAETVIQLNQKVISNIRLSPSTVWWKGPYHIDTGKTIDGTWSLKGAVLLDTVFRQEETDPINKVQMREKVYVKHTFNEFEENLALLLDGNWGLNGAETLENPIRLVKRTPIRHELAISERNIYDKFIDGTWNLDGTNPIGGQRRMNGKWLLDGVYLMDAGRKLDL